MWSQQLWNINLQISDKKLWSYIKKKARQILFPLQTRMDLWSNGTKPFHMTTHDTWFCVVPQGCVQTMACYKRRSAARVWLWHRRWPLKAVAPAQCDLDCGFHSQSLLVSEFSFFFCGVRVSKQNLKIGFKCKVATVILSGNYEFVHPETLFPPNENTEVTKF